MKKILIVGFVLVVSFQSYAQNRVVSNLQFREIKKDIIGSSDVFEAVTHMSLDSDGITDFVIETSSGDIEIVPSESSKIEAYAKVYVSEKSSDKAYALAVRSLNLELKRVAKSASLISNFEETSDRMRNGKYSVDLMIKVPKHIQLDIDDGSGDIEMRDIKNNFTCVDGSGDITLDNVSGIINIDDGSGDISIYSHKATLNGENVGEIKDGSGDILIKNMIQSLSIKDESGDIEVQNVTGSLNITDTSGDIELNTVSQSVNIVDGAGEIEMEEIGLDINIIDGPGDIEVKNVGGDFIVERNSSGDIETNNIGGKLKLPKE